MKKFIPMVGLILSMAAVGTNAQTSITKYEMNKSTGLLTIEGVTDVPGEMVSVNIPKYGISADDLQKEDSAIDSLLYCEQKSSGEDGKFSFTVTFSAEDTEGIYDVYVGDEAGAAAGKVSIAYLSAENYEDFIEALNTAAKTSQTEFNKFLAENEWKLYVNTDYEIQNRDVLEDILYNYAKEDGFSTTDSELNINVYKAALTAQLISEKNISDINSLLDEMYKINSGVLEDYDVISDYKTYIDTDAKREYFAEHFENCASLAEFEDAFADALVLTVVRYPENVSDIEDVFKKYKAYLDVNTANAGISDYSAIAGKEYSDIASCVDDFNDTVKSQDSSSGSSSGNSSGGSRGSSTGIINVVTEDIGANRIDIKFEDLNSVQWAYTAISELFERGVINGRSETRFAPNDKVKREEFVKMLVEAADITVNNERNVFSDVSENAWYKGYVNTAYENGLCNGIGDGLFGVGMEITRQDMCVMAYNLLKFLGQETNDGELTFDDASDFGEYAKVPVSALQSAGIVNGVGDNKFDPYGNATRAQAAVIIYNLLMYIE